MHREVEGAEIDDDVIDFGGLVLEGSLAFILASGLTAACSSSNVTAGNDGGRADASRGGSTSGGNGDGGSSSGSGSGLDSGEDSGRSSGKPDSGSSARDATTDANMPDSGGRCLISGITYPSGTPSPTNACQGCQPTVSTTVWSDLIDGTTCGTDGICHAGACVSGCEIGGVYYTTTAVNPNNACQTCQPGTSTTAWGDVVDGTGCGNDQICVGGQCGTQCDVGDAAVVPSGSTNPANVCQSCAPGTSTSSWTTTNGVNASCPAGDVCSGTCQWGCWIGGTFYAGGVTATTNGCQTCQPAMSTTAWTNVSGPASCPSAEICNGGSCTSGCFIAGVFHLPGTTGDNGCGVCTPGASTSMWTSAPDGTNCGSGSICVAGACAMECDIAGTGIVSAGTVDPGNACQSCQPGTSATGWTNVADGTSCGTRVCKGGACGTGYPGCAHSACDTGPALTSGCDTNGDGIVSAVCEEVDASCCTQSWTSTCVSYAEEWCTYIGGCVSDPDCA